MPPLERFGHFDGSLLPSPCSEMAFCCLFARTKALLNTQVASFQLRMKPAFAQEPAMCVELPASGNLHLRVML